MGQNNDLFQVNIQYTDLRNQGNTNAQSATAT